ncbi:WxL domain-containing protein [Streptomyces sp. NBC_00433]
MRNRRIVIPIVAGALGVLPLAASASAASSGSTPVTVTVTTGTLDITVPAGPVSLGTVPALATAQTVSAQLGNVTVTDSRGGTTGWTVTANGNDFIGPSSTISVSTAGSSTYTSPLAAVTGTASVAPSDLNPLYPPGPVQTATGVVGVNSATWNPTITLNLPANTVAGTYTSTIIHSVA